MNTSKRLLTIIVAAALAASGFAAVARAQEPGPIDDYAVASLAEAAGISREEAARRLQNQGPQAELAERLAEQLGDRSGGSYLDRRSGELIVNVLDDRAAEQVRAAGATPRTVRYSTAGLQRVSDRLDPEGAAGRSGLVTSIGVDPQTDTVLVTIPAAAQREAAQFVEQTRSSYGDQVSFEYTEDPAPEQQSSYVYAGGQHISSALGNCTAGLAAKDANNYRYMLTALHCVSGNAYNVYTSGQFFGQRWYQSQNYYDMATVLNWNPANMIQTATAGPWYNYVVIKGALTSIQNWWVCKSGMTTGWKCGYVVLTGQKVWVGGSVGYEYNLTAAKLCGQGGDSGAPVVFQTLQGYWYATGIHSAGPAVCTASSNSFFVPVKSLLNASGLSIVTG